MATNPRDFLTEYQQQILGNFQEIVQIQDDQLCIDLLQQNNWNLEHAVNAFMLGGAAAASSPSSRQQSRRNLDAPRPSTDRSTNRIYSTEETHFEQFQAQESEGAEDTTVTSANSNSGGLLDLVLYPIRWLFTKKSFAFNPNRDATNFIQEFQSEYGTSHVPFHRGSYQSAVAAAFQQSKFLLIYLHSPLHQDNDQFARQVLCDSTFTNFVNENMIVWGGQVFDPEAYGLSSQLSVTSYPFLALVVCQSARSVQIADRLQGIVDLEDVINRLRNVSGIYSAIIERSRLETERRAEAIRLREQQDREYQESIEAERREIERQREEEEAKIRAEEERRQQEEEAAAIELSKKLTRENEIRKLKAAFAASPEPDASPDVATIRFQLPRAKKLTYRFHKSDKAQVRSFHLFPYILLIFPLQRIYDYLRLQFADEGDLTLNFSMSTTFPKMEINDFSKTIEELVR